MSSGQSSHLWLIRTAQNVVTGPFEKDYLKSLISDGELDLQDEICAGNSYWIALHEREEVIAQLGIAPPIPASMDGTGGTEEMKTRTDVSELPAARVSDAVGTTVMKTVRPQRNEISGSEMPAARPLEAPTVWRGFAIALVLSAFAILIAVLRALSLHHP